MLGDQTGYAFEAEVRRIARLLWPSRTYQSAQIVDGLERDAYVETDDTIHIVEATTDRRLSKAEHDLKKTADLVGKLRKNQTEKLVKGWFITKDELTADQAAAAKKYDRTVTALPYKAFLSRLIDTSEYLTLRNSKPFGSVADPADNHFDVPQNTYVPPFFHSENDNKALPFDEFFNRITSEKARSILLGDFGAGKSMNMREVFYRSRSKFSNGKSNRFPIYLNLRSHAGQASPTEALIREAMTTGYAKYDDLVKAWRADLSILILDGFDELVTPAWSQKASQLREHRAACVRLITEFVSESPKNTPIVICGRPSYFGSSSEMLRAFKTPEHNNVYRLNDFTKDQASAYLSKIGRSASIPEWLPPRPLLLGYIASISAKQGVDVPMEDIDPSVGWDLLFDRICERETAIHTGLFTEYVRRVLERIGTKARYRTDATQGIGQQDIASAYTEVFGRPPDDSSLGMLLRLPGMVAIESSGELRRFVDSDFASIAAAGDVFEFIASPNSQPLDTFENCVANIDDLGANFIISKISRQKFTEELIPVALETLSKHPGTSTLKGDLLSCLAASSLGRRTNWIGVSQASSEKLDLKYPPDIFKDVKIYDSAFNVLELDVGDLERIPEFSSCMIGLIRGPRDAESLGTKLRDTSVDRFEFEEMTNNAILDLPIPNGVKVGLTILRKLFVQGGGGRQEGAFSRGIRPEQQRLVAPALEAVVSCGFAKVSNRGSGTGGERIYMKNAERLSEAREIVLKNGSVTCDLITQLHRID